ncbi:MAG: hypothetical protein CHACPFDD_01019 [Phycisphaerae bacterium]|nr:hypothetical protein [Phycisphaerae bacterium]
MTPATTFAGIKRGMSSDRDSQSERIRRGDRQAIADAMGAYRDRLARVIAFRMDPRLAGRVAVDDVLQEAYLAAGQRCANLRGDSEAELFVWLRMIVLQTLIDLHRRHVEAAMRDVRQEIGWAWPDGREATGRQLALALAANLTSPTEAARRDERHERLRVALANLSENDREVLALRHFEELDNHEVAAALQIESKAASIRYVRALRRLKRVLEECGLDSSTGAAATT